MRRLRSSFGRSWRFNPLHCGAVVASARRRLRDRRTRRMFQSPSLRGSGRFLARKRGHRRRSNCFNPLHCGAVVASGDGERNGRKTAVFQSPSLRGSGRFSAPRADARRRGAVSIPFIAGQWSLHAVVDDDALEPLVVSIPFIAGQWSLLAEAFDAEADLDGFQSPSLRGSGRFAMGPLP